VMLTKSGRGKLKFRVTGERRIVNNMKVYLIQNLFVITEEG
jgi:hypothetical protein